MADATAQATERAQEVAGQAKDKAQEAAGQAKGRVREQVDQRSTEAGKQVSTTAGDLRSVSEELRKQGKDTPARVAEQAADRTERLGSYLTESDADRILGDVEDLARRQPWTVVAGGLALGFAASRLLKASSSQRYQQGIASNGNGADPTTPRLSNPPPVATAPPPAPNGGAVPAPSPYTPPVPR
jgi:uncharacterized protein YpuA (DUF1002 family)